MKHLVQAIAVLSVAEKKIEEDYYRERLALINGLEKAYAERRRLIQHAKRSIERRFAETEAFHSEIWERLRPAAPTAADTTKRMKRGFIREQAAKLRTMSSGKNTGQKRGSRS